MTDEEIQEIWDRIRNVTPGPWWPSFHDYGFINVYFDKKGGIIGSIISPINALFIANARNDIVDLLKEVGRLKNELSKK